MLLYGPCQPFDTLFLTHKMTLTNHQVCNIKTIWAHIQAQNTFWAIYSSKLWTELLRCQLTKLFKNTYVLKMLVRGGLEWASDMRPWFGIMRHIMGTLLSDHSMVNHLNQIITLIPHHPTPQTSVPFIRWSKEYTILSLVSPYVVKAGQTMPFYISRYF